MEELEILAPMIVTVTLILVVGAVILLKPVSKQASALLEQMLKDRRAGQGTHDSERLTATLEGISERMRLLEERQTFAESLIQTRSEEPLLIPREPDAAKSEE
jgi:hypothetical protein